MNQNPIWTEVHDLMAEAAWRARGNAWAPYSGFKVGCALLTSEGNIVAGCNVENASYGLTQCAERCAVCVGVANGHHAFTDAVVVTDQLDPAPPCGACRQVLYEFGANMRVWLLGSNGVREYHRIVDLLPHAFTFQPGNATTR